MPLPRIVLFTAQDIGVNLITTLREHADLFVVTHSTIRDELAGYRSPTQTCQHFAIPVVVTPRVDESVARVILEFKPRLILSAYYPHVIPASLIEQVPLGAVNLHPGILPFYRGKFPTPWYILNGESDYGLALHRIVDDGIDTGPVLVQERFPLSPTITGHELLLETMKNGVALIHGCLSAILDNSLPAVPQKGVGSYYSTIEKRYQIDWNLRTVQIERRIRVHAKPYLPAYSYLLNRIVYINRAVDVQFDGFAAQGGGSIVGKDTSAFYVSCCDGVLRVDEWDVFPPVSQAESDLLFRVGNRFE